MTEVSVETIQRMWIVTLVVYGVVLVVVAVLLTLILRAAREVRAGVSAIWTVGQQVANNTIHIALLDTHESHRRRDPRVRRGGRGRDGGAAGACRALPRVPGLRARDGGGTMSAMVMLTVISVAGCGRRCSSRWRCSCARSPWNWR